MLLNQFPAAAGYIGSALGVSMVIPQLVRTFRNPTMPGVSAGSWTLTALACTTWLLYGVRAHELPQIPGNVLLVSGAVALILVLPARVPPPVRAAWLAAAGVGLVAIATVAPTMLVGFLAFGLGLVSAVPQTVKSLVERHRPASAVSVPSWLLRVASQACWLTYALTVHDIAVTVSATVIMSNAVLLVTVELRRSRLVRAPELSAATG